MGLIMKLIPSLMLNRGDVGSALKAISSKKRIKQSSKVKSFPLPASFPTSIEGYILGRVLGHGEYGKVFHAKVKRRGKTTAVAIKDIDLLQVNKRGLEDQVASEMKIHSSLSHPFIIPLLTCFFGVTRLYLIFSYAPNGSLFDFLKAQPGSVLSHEVAAKYIYQTATALWYCHSMKVIHRDIKPENILLDRFLDVKLCDFGWACKFKSCGHRELCGTSEYLPPEMLTRRTYNETVDIWSLGVLSYELVSGVTPFKGRSQKEMLNKMFNMEIKYPGDLPKSGIQLISGMLQFDSQKRMSLDKVTSHMWIKQHLRKKMSNT